MLAIRSATPGRAFVRLLPNAGFFGLSALAISSHGQAATAPNYIGGSVGVCDYATPANCAKPDSNGVLPTKQVDSGNTNATCNAQGYQR